MKNRARWTTMRIVCVMTVVLWTGGTSAAAETTGISLRLPLDCTPGQDCWIANYVDTDPGPTASDFTCGPRTYDGHNGTDIAIRDEAAMRRGVAVIAAAAGTVRATRDGMHDVDFRSRPSRRIRDRDCGNGVLIDHGNRWTTQYCHLRRGSIAVRKGDMVSAGQKIGLVGLSGRTMFPHLHLTVRQGKEVRDPFTGASNRAGCRQPMRPIWDAKTREALPYRPAAIVNAGFARTKPEASAIRRGDRPKRRVTDRIAPLVLWVDVFGVRKDDVIRFTIEGPNDAVVFRHVASIAKDQARRFAFAGRKAPAQGWRPGDYRGVVRVTRSGDSGSVQTEASALIAIR